MTKAIEIIRLRLNNPCMTLQQVGNKVNLTRERVRQILKECGLPTRNYKWLRAPLRRICPLCGKSKGPQANTCKECRLHQFMIPLSCSECGSVFYRMKSQVLRQPHNRISDKVGVFCSKKCYGRWFGRNHGFAAHPEHSGHGRLRKYDWDLVWQKHLETGWGSLKLSRLLNIPISTIDYILATKRKEQAER